MIKFDPPTIAGVAENYLCCSCGACEAVCPEKAIHYKETPGGYLFPVINGELCTECGKCLRCCSGITLAADLPSDPFVGEIQGCWIARATDDAVYAGSQSGGGVTALLMALMAEGKIEGAVTVTMEAGTPPRPVVLIARTREEILAAQGSKYCPTPVLSVLKELTGQSGPIAIVGLACHVHGLHNLFEELPELRRKVSPVIGLVCDRIMSYGAIDYLLHRASIEDGKPVSLKYRSKEYSGYPGDVRICGEGNDAIFLPSAERIKIKDYFTPARCRLCFDKMNVLADVTAADPWGVTSYDKERGESVLIARTRLGHEIVHTAANLKYLRLRDISYNEVLVGQAIKKKRKAFAAYCGAWSSMRRPLPTQAESARSTVLVHKKNRRFEWKLRHALTLDQFRSRQAMVRHAMNRLKRREILKRFKRAINPLSSGADQHRGKRIE